MGLKQGIYHRLPIDLRRPAERWYYRVTEGEVQRDLHAAFVDEFFRSRDEYERLIDEFENDDVGDIRKSAIEKYQTLTGKTGMGTTGLRIARDYYAIVRKLEPSRIVETGVCNGLSTLTLLSALRKNESGQLYSIDYPFRADESLDEFREETFERYAGAAIPSDKDPGWIVPDELKDRWELIVGKSQRELPQLVVDLDQIDLFVHDSEHSHPCMMFEYELAYEWLANEGVIVSDDITWNDAFQIFVDDRDPTWGKLSSNVGYMKKGDSSE